MGPRYLLDTNICIYIANNRPVKVRRRFKQSATVVSGVFPEFRFALSANWKSITTPAQSTQSSTRKPWIR